MLEGGTGSGWPCRSCAKIGGAIAESKPRVKKRLVSRLIFLPRKTKRPAAETIGVHCGQRWNLLTAPKRRYHALLQLSPLLVHTSFPVTEAAPSGGRGCGNSGLQMRRSRNIFPTKYQLYGMGTDAILGLICGSTRQTPPSSKCRFLELALAPSSNRIQNTEITVTALSKYRVKGIRTAVPQAYG